MNLLFIATSEELSPDAGDEPRAAHASGMALYPCRVGSIGLLGDSIRIKGRPQKQHGYQNEKQ
jgi:hypothetical protein